MQWSNVPRGKVFPCGFIRTFGKTSSSNTKPMSWLDTFFGLRSQTFARLYTKGWHHRVSPHEVKVFKYLTGIFRETLHLKLALISLCPILLRSIGERRLDRWWHAAITFLELLLQLGDFFMFCQYRSLAFFHSKRRNKVNGRMMRPYCESHHAAGRQPTRWKKRFEIVGHSSESIPEFLSVISITSVARDNTDNF